MSHMAGNNWISVNGNLSIPALWEGVRYETVLSGSKVMFAKNFLGLAMDGNITQSLSGKSRMESTTLMCSFQVRKIWCNRWSLLGQAKRIYQFWLLLYFKSFLVFFLNNFSEIFGEMFFCVKYFCKSVQKYFW